MTSRPPYAPQLLVLWDIDHTLIETRGVGLAIYQRAFLEATGRQLDRLTQIGGRTELDIMRETLRINGIEPADRALGALAAALVRGYDDARNELATTGRRLPGAAPTLHQLAADSRVLQGVLTGNLRDVARIKLEVFDMAEYLDLDVSAYGDDHSERACLVFIAQRRASDRVGIEFDNAHTVLLGDTPNDVYAAITAGVRVIAVASGKSNAAELAAAGAPVVLADLTNPAHTIGLIMNEP